MYEHAFGADPSLENPEAYLKQAQNAVERIKSRNPFIESDYYALEAAESDVTFWEGIIAETKQLHHRIGEVEYFGSFAAE